MTEWNENRLDQELEEMMQEMPEADDLDLRISKSINRKIRNVVVRTVAVILACILVAFAIVNPLMNLVFFNPKAYNQEPDLTMLRVMRTYIDMISPYGEVYELGVESKGFGRYEISMELADCTQRQIGVGSYNMWWDCNWGTYENIKDAEGNLTQHPGRFMCIWEDSKEYMENFKELPESAMIYLSVSDKEVKSLEEVKNLPAKLAWIQIYQPSENVLFQAGIDMQEISYLDGDSEIWHKDMTEEELLETYLSKLELVIKYEKLWEQFGYTDGNNRSFLDNKDALRETYENAKTLDKIQVKNYSVYGKRDEIVQFLEENPLDSIYVENVRLW